jgi:DNA-binding response OmpR family regulator
MARLLLVEDDPTIGSVLRSSLASAGHDIMWCVTGSEALQHVVAQPVELALLDLGLPDIDGIELCRRIRVMQPECVLVLLTARQGEMDVVVGLEAGADDYLTKPIRLGELIARVRAHLRRCRPEPSPTEVIVIGDLKVDTVRRRVFVGEREVVLRTKEFDLLARFAGDHDIALSRSTLMADVWDDHWSGSTRTLDMHVLALRRNLGSEPASRIPRIVTLRGFGYRLEGPK